MAGEEGLKSAFNSLEKGSILLLGGLNWFQLLRLSKQLYA